MATDLGIPDVEDSTEIGRGGFGVVYKAHQARFDRTIAVKVLEQAQLDEAGRQRFERECKALGALSGHPNVVTIYDSGFTAAGWPYLVLEYLPDGSLGDRVDRDGPLDIDQATELIVKIAGALETAHRIGVLHRDMKPENILLGPYEEPKLGDFGIARVQGATVTSTSTIWGSPAHAAPEIIEGKGATIQTDIYSLGSTLYVLLSGRLAFQRETDESIIPVLARIATELPPDLRPVGVPDDVWTVVARSMAKDPAKRQATAMEFGTELQAARQAIGLPRGEMRIKGEQYGRRSGPRPATAAAAPTATSSPGPPPATSSPQPVYSPQPAAGPTWASQPATPAGYARQPQPNPSANAVYTPPDTTSTFTSQPSTSPSSPYPGPQPEPQQAATSNSVWYAAIAVLAVALVIALVVVVLATRRGSPPPPTTPRASLPGTLAPVTLKRALLNPADISSTSRWSVSSDFGGFTGFSFLTPCAKSIDTSAIAQQQFTLFEGTTPDDEDGRIFQAVAEFEDESAARQFMQRIPSLIGCGTWTDDQGYVHNAVTQNVSNPAGDESAIVEDIYRLEGDATVYDHDYAFYRKGRFVGFVTNLVEGQNDKNFTEDLLGLGVQQLQKATG